MKLRARLTGWALTLWNVVLVGVFLVLILLPSVDWQFGFDSAPPIVENRPPAPQPARPHGWQDLRAFPAAFERYWNDGFGFRRRFVQTHNRLLVALGNSPLPDRVTVGSGGWLFYTAEGALEEYKGNRPFRESEMIRWQHLLENRRDWLTDRGISYVFFIAPSKESIYGAYMPRRIPRGPTHRLDQLLEFMKVHSDFEIVDVRDLLSSAAASEPIYFKTDSHWNGRGAWLVKERVIAHLAKAFPAVKQGRPADLSMVVKDDYSGDMAGILGLGGQISESITFVNPATPHARPMGTPIKASSWTATNDPNLPRGVFFHDSFGKLQLSLFAEHFRWLRGVYIDPMDPEIVEAEQPQVVLQEMAERFLIRRLPDDSMVLSDNSRIRGAFDASTDVLIRIPDDAAAITPLGALSVDPPADGTMVLHVEARQEPRALQLPEMHLGAESFPVMRLEIESPADGRLEGRYRTVADPNYQDVLRSWWPLRAGTNVAWMMFPDPELTGRLRLDLTAPGTYRLKSLEVRAVPRPQRRG